MSSKAKKGDAYFNEARSFEVDRMLQAKRSRTLAWITAGVATSIAVVTSVSTVALTLRPADPPVVIRVSEATGVAEVVSRLKGGDTTYDEVTSKYFSELYVVQREGFSKELAENTYNTVGLLSGSVEQKRFFDSFNPKNPMSPLNVFGDTTKVKIRVKGSSFIKSNVLLVRYTREVERPGAERPEVSHWAATVVFKFSGSPMSEKDRRINPLGYQVMEYRVDPDAASDARATTAVAVAPAPQPASTVTVLPAPGPAATVPAIAPTGAQQ